MKNILSLILLFFYPLLSSADAPIYKDLGNWKISVDTSLNNGCFAYAAYDGGTIWRIGFNLISNSFYVAIGDMDWRSIEPGKDYPVEIQFDNELPWTGDASGVDFNGVPALWLDINLDQVDVFFEEFMRKQTVEVTYNNDSIAFLNLKGTYAAGQTLLECQGLFDEKPSSSDPFTERSSKDPFSS